MDLTLLGKGMNYSALDFKSVLKKKKASQYIQPKVEFAHEAGSNINKIFHDFVEIENMRSSDEVAEILESEDFNKALDKLMLWVNEPGITDTDEQLLEVNKELSLKKFVGIISETMPLVDDLRKQITFLKKMASSDNTLIDNIKNDVTNTRKLAGRIKDKIDTSVGISNNIGALNFNDKEADVDYFLSCISTIIFNDIIPGEEIAEDDDKDALLHYLKTNIRKLSNRIHDKVGNDLSTILHDPDFKRVEANWFAVRELVETTDWTEDVTMDLLDVSKEDLKEDFDNSQIDLTGSALFDKVYTSEYDQYGGIPYSVLIGFYEFKNNLSDRKWLKTMSRISAAAHAPFLGSVGYKFFGCESTEELSEIKNIEGHMSHPRFDDWNRFRETKEAAYVGLTMPRYLFRKPYHTINNPAGDLDFIESIDRYNGNKDFLYGSSSVLFVKNMIRSYIESGWCQYLRGPIGGGLQTNLPRYLFDDSGEGEMKIPVEMVIPDYREHNLAKAGFIPLIYRKYTSDACFFSCQSIKKPKKFKDPEDTENSQLVTNLAYTFSITRIAHYIKCMMRDRIGTPLDAGYINNMIQNWLLNYVTTVTDPDDRTLRYYPFKAAVAETVEEEGMIGWYKSTVKILPHIQFEGLDVELQLEVRL